MSVHNSCLSSAPLPAAQIPKSTTERVRSLPTFSGYGATFNRFNNTAIKWEPAFGGAKSGGYLGGSRSVVAGNHHGSSIGTSADATARVPPDLVENCPQKGPGRRMHGPHRWWKVAQRKTGDHKGPPYQLWTILPVVNNLNDLEGHTISWPDQTARSWANSSRVGLLTSREATSKRNVMGVVAVPPVKTPIRGALNWHSRSFISS